MAACTQGALSVGGVVDCVILKQFVQNNMGTGFRNVMVCDDMVSRRAGLYERSDAFVALPGGLGTLEELAEVLSWRQLQFHDKPIVLVNTNGFYDAFWQFVKAGIRKGFIAKEIAQCLLVVDTPEEVVTVINNYDPLIINKSGILDSDALAELKVTGNR